MKKFRTLITCLILLTSCVIFASCSKGDERVEFDETSPVVLEVGETYSPSISVSPEKRAADVVFLTSDAQVVVVSPDKTLVAVGVGVAQIEAKVGESTANLVVEVVAKKEKLDTPVGFHYEAQTNRIVWSKVNNANSYDVEIDGEIVAKNLTTNFYELVSSNDKSVRIKANGIGKYSDSDFTSVYKFKNLQAPTSLTFNKTTQTLSWNHDGGEKFRVCVNNILFDLVEQKSFVLPLENVGSYDVCVVAIADDDQKDGDTLVFDSLRSESLQITRLDAVDNNSIAWNASETLLTWGEVKGAKYRVKIGTQDPIEAQTNSLTIKNLEKGNYEIKITAISDQPLVLDAKEDATSNVAITKQLPTPIIQKYDEGTNSITLSDFGEAQDFKILCDGVEIYSGYASISGDTANIVLPVGTFKNAGNYTLTAISKADEARFYTQSSTSDEYAITRLAAPTNLRVENGRNFAFSTNPQANFGSVVFVSGAEHSLIETVYDLFDLDAGTYEVKAKYLGNKNNVLESDYATLTVTKLPTPVLEFDKSDATLYVDKSLGNEHEYDITINGALQRNVRLSQTCTYSLSGMLATGENNIEVQTLTKDNEVLSDVATIDINKVEEIQNLTHESVGDVSFIKLSTNDKFDGFVVWLGDQMLDHTISYNGDTTILTLKDNTSQIFAEAGDYEVIVEAKSNDANSINPTPATLSITKLPQPTGLEFEFPNKFSWNKFVDIENNFNFIITKEEVEIFNKTTTENNFSVQNLALGALKAQVKVLGNGRDVLDSNYCDAVEFSHEKLSRPQNIEYSSDMIIWSAVEGANCYEISIGQQKYESQSNSFRTLDLSVGQYQATIKAKNSEDESITGDSTSFDFTITRKLASPLNLAFDKATRTLSFDAVTNAENGAMATASKYMVYINSSSASTEYTNKTSFTFNSDAFQSAGQYVLEVQAFGEGAYVDVSEKSQPLIVTKLAAPTSISIDDEIVSCGFDADVVDHVEILINGVQGTSLADISGEIDVKAKYIGKTDLLIDSEYFQTTIHRLGKISDFRLENDIICWSSVANASGYVVSVKPENENLEKFYFDSDVSSYAYDFRYEGNYSIEIYAQGGIVGENQYLDSAHEIIEAQKCVAPTNVQLVEDPTEGLITISFDYSGEENSASKFGVYVGQTQLGETATTTYQCSSSHFSAVGSYTIWVKAVGNNSSNFVSSVASDLFQTTRLSNPYAYYTLFDGQNYTFSFISISTETDYRVLIQNEIINGEEVTSKTIKDVTIEKSSSFYQVVDFSEEMQSNEYVDGQIKITIVALGNNTTTLRSVTSSSAYSFAPRPIVSNNADKLLITRTSAEYSVSTSYYYEDSLGNKSQEITIDEACGYVDEYTIPNTWLPGKYTFIVSQYISGGVISAPTTFTVTRLANVAEYSLSRDETNSDIIYLNWSEVEDAQGYIVYAAQDQYGSNALQIYNGTARKIALPLSDIQDGQVFFFFQALGGEGIGFSSQTVWVGSNKVKLFSQGLNLRNNNGVLAWSEYGVSQLCAGYKLVINGDYENAITLDSTTFSHSLEGYSGQLNIKLKQIGDFVNAWGVDSDYVELNIVKLPTPTNVRVVEGEIRWDFGYTLGEGETVDFVYNIGDMTFDATTEGIAQLTATLIANKEYKATVQALNTSVFLTSDKSSEIIVKLLENPNSNDGSTNISTNSDKTISSFNWASATGAGKYEVRVDGGELTEPISTTLTDSSWTISGLAAGQYDICVRRIGGTGAIDGVNYLSSGFSTPIAFSVLDVPQVFVSNGELAWLSQVGANNYYLYIGDSYKPCGNVTFWTFLDEYKDYTKETEISLFMQAIGDGVEYIASAKTSEIKVVKPRPPQPLVVKDGALCWGDLEAYTYYEDTQNKNIYLDFIQNEITVESFEIDIKYLKSGWPLDDDYLQKLTNNLPAGEYTLKIKQIGDSDKVITSEYAQETLDIVVAPSPTNVKIDNHKLQWNAVSLEQYNETEETVYVIYAFDSIENDWIKLAETNATFLNVENTDGLLKPQHIALAVATKGNTTTGGYLNYVTGNMSEKVDITVLGSTSDLQTVDGNLTWGIVSNAVEYRIESETNNMVVSGGVQSSYLKGFAAGVHNIKIRALGNGSSLSGNCIINGVWGQASTFTKLAQPVASSQTTETDDKREWGSFRWEAIDFANGYNIYINDEYYNHIENNIYESDYAYGGMQSYQFQAKGNSVTPSETNIAYISSDPSEKLERARYEKIEGVMVRDGKLYWLPASGNSYPTFYFVEFFKGDDKTRVVVEVGSSSLVQIDNRSMVEFDVAGYVEEGSYTVLVRQTNNSATYIIGIESDPIEISKLEAPNNVRLEYGVLTWDNVEGATNYVINIVSSENVAQKIEEGFSYDASANAWRWTSNLATGVYNVAIRAISTDENKLNSSWATKDGELTGSTSDWVVRQIPQISLGNITVDASHIVWQLPSSSANIPKSHAYQVWRKGSETYEATIVKTAEYDIDEDLLGIAIRIIPYGQNDYDYFASVFSEMKTVDKPLPPTGLSYDATKQIFTWDKADTSDATYIVYYTLNEVEHFFETSENKFEPTKLGSYSVQVKVQTSKTALGTSEKCDAVEGEFNLFEKGEGTNLDPFEVDLTNFKNIIYRPNAYFKLIEDISLNDMLPLGGNGTSSPTQFLGSLDGNSKTITVSFAKDKKYNLFGIFAEIGAGAKVENLNVRVDGDIEISGTSSSMNVGVIAGKVNGTDAIIQNCTVSGSITLIRNDSYNSDTRFGAIAGLLEEGSIKNCTNNLNITSSVSYISKIGGIVGVVGSAATVGKAPSTNAIVASCTNNGTITDANIAGGIAADNYGTIKNCKNYATVSSDVYYSALGNTEVKQHSIAGGIVGRNYGTTDNSGVVGGIVEDCKNFGVVTAGNTLEDASDANSFAGGIVGWTSGGKINNNYGMADAVVGDDNHSTTTSRGAVVGKFETYSETSENFYLRGLVNEDGIDSCTLTPVD